MLSFYATLGWWWVFLKLNSGAPFWVKLQVRSIYMRWKVEICYTLVTWDVICNDFHFEDFCNHKVKFLKSKQKHMGTDRLWSHDHMTRNVTKPAFLISCGRLLLKLMYSLEHSYVTLTHMLLIVIALCFPISKTTIYIANQLVFSLVFGAREFKFGTVSPPCITSTNKGKIKCMATKL